MDYKSDPQSDDDFDCSNGYSDSFGNNNNSNSGYNTNGESRMPNPNGLSKAELRKTNKPIMEKRRRARINHCLNELKSLILEAMKKDPARHTKLEKADILEMTVKHLQSVQRQQLNMAIQTDPSVVHKFKTGFVECADEVQRYVGQLEGVDVGVRQRLSNHLKNCATSLEQLGSMTNFNNGYRGQLGAAGVAGLFGGALPNPLVPSTVTAPNVIFPPPLPQDPNNNSNSSAGAPIQMGGVQLIPSRLPSGEFALIMPNASGASAANLLNNNAFASAAFAAWPNATPSNAAAASAAQLPGSTAMPQLNDFTTHAFQHMSAFSLPQQPKVTTLAANNNSHTIKSTNYSSTTTKTVVSAFNQAPPTNNLHHNSTATTSPPLSPISSACSSSHGDDSIMHTSSDFANSRPATPPLDVANSQHNFSGVFSTPSSAESSMLSLSSRSSTHLQQQQVSSTSGSDLNSTGSSTSATAANTNARSSLKRSLTESADSIDSSDEPSSKKFADNQQSEKWENEGKEKEQDTSLQKQSEGDRQQQKTKGPLIIDERDSMWRPW